MKREFSNSKKGSVLAIRVQPRAEKNKILEILEDSSIIIQLASSTKNKEINSQLIGFLSEVFEISQSNIEIVSGKKAKDKLVSIMDINPTYIQKILINKKLQ